MPINITMPITSPYVSSFYGFEICNLHKTEIQIEIKFNKLYSILIFIFKKYIRVLNKILFLRKVLKFSPQILNILPSNHKTIFFEVYPENLCEIFEELHFNCTKLSMFLIN